MPDFNNEPYVGPRPFQRGESELFFGRDSEADTLFSLIVAHQAVLLHARSGAGKSSLVNAKLIPLLEGDGFNVLPIARVATPNQHGLVLAGNVFTAGILLSLTEDSNRASDFLGLPLDVFLLQPGKANSKPRVLVIDQLEELFTLSPDRWQDRRTVFEELGRALDNDPHLRLLLSLREDYLAELDPYERLLPEEFRTKFRLEPLREKAALTAISGPLQSRGIHLAEGVAEQLVDDLLLLPNAQDSPTRGEFVEPVQLQVVCLNIWRNVKSTQARLVTSDHLATFGNVEQVLKDLYDHAVQKAACDCQLSEGLLRRWIEESLITPIRTRGIIFQGSVAPDTIPASVLDIFRETRIVSAVNRGGALWYELAHDRLIGPILESNRGWLLARSGNEDLRRRLEIRASTWVTHNSSHDTLLNEDELAEAQRWLSDPETQELGASERVTSFIRASESYHRELRDREELKNVNLIADLEKRRNLLLRRGLLLLAFMVIASITLAIYALYSRNEQAKLRAKERDASAQAVLLLQQGETRYENGNPKFALEQLERAVALFRSLQDFRHEALALNAAAKVYIGNGNTREALILLLRALELNRKAKDSRNEAAILDTLGKLYRKLYPNDSRRAMDCFEQAAAIYRSLSDERNLSLSFIEIGRLLNYNSDPDRAGEFFRRSLELSKELRDPLIESEALYGLGRVEALRGNPLMIERYTSEALKRLYNARLEATGSGKEDKILGSLQLYTDSEVDALIELHESTPKKGFDEKALVAHEEYSHLKLFDALSLPREEDQANTPVGIHIIALKEKLNSAALLRFSIKPMQRQRMLDDNVDIKVLVEELSRSRSLLVASGVQPEPMTLKKIQSGIASDSALFEYHLGEARSILWVVTSDSLTSFILPSRKLIEDSAEETYSALSRARARSGEDLRSKIALEKLSTLVLGHFPAHLAHHRLIVAREGSLSIIPFAALLNPLNKFTTNMAVDHEIVNTPSLKIALKLRERRKQLRSERGIAVIADPVLSYDDPRLEHLVLNTPSDEMSMRLPRSRFERLEASEIAKLASSDRTLLALDFNANREMVTNGRLAKFKIIHFATHFFTDPEFPVINSIALSRFNRAGLQKDALLHAYDFPTLDISPELIVLSGCRTALNLGDGGGRDSSLSRSFLGIGVPEVIGSLWDVDDASTAEIMKLFYIYRLREGLSTAAALRKAQIQIGKSARWQSAYYWGAFEIEGDGL